MEIKPTTHHKASLCAAVVGYGHSCQIPWLQRCQQSVAHTVDGVGVCGTHYNAGFRGELIVVRSLRQLDDGDL